MEQLVMAEPAPAPAIEWWWIRRNLLAHAFRVGSDEPWMTSLCGLARWTVLARETYPEDARCADCERDGLTEAEARVMDGNR